MKLQLRNQPEHSVMLRSGLVSLGRDPSNGLVLESEDVSDFHAEVTVDGDQVFIADLLSSTGTFVNDRRIGSRHRLQPWDVIRLGSVELELNDPMVAKPNIWSVQITHPQGETERFDLTDTTVIGRDPGCDISLDSDLLSRRHAEIRVVKDYLEVFDLGSVNGTFVNGRAVEHTLAYANDELTIDPYRLLIVGPSKKSEEIPDASDDRTHIKGNGVQFNDDVDQTELIEPDLPLAYLIEESSLLDQPTTLLKNPLIFGRLPDNDVVISDRSVSKLHARIEFLDGEWVIEDCGSSNGVKVNDKLVSRETLQHDDMFALGRAVFRFKLGQP